MIQVLGSMHHLSEWKHVTKASQNTTVYHPPRRKSFTLEMPIENQEGERELQEDSSKVNAENSEMAPKPKRQRKSREVNSM